MTRSNILRRQTNGHKSNASLISWNSDRPSAWCRDNWIHWRAVKSAFSVEGQLRDILHRLTQVPTTHLTFLSLLTNDALLCAYLISLSCSRERFRRRSGKAVRVNCSEGVCALGSSPMLPGGIHKESPHLCISVCLSEEATHPIFLFFPRSIGKSFCTMDGHGSTVHIHPSSAVWKTYTFAHSLSI